MAGIASRVAFAVSIGLLALGAFVVAAIVLLSVAARPRVVEVDPRVRAPEAPLARAVRLPGWSAAAVDSSDVPGLVTTRLGTVGGIVVREVEGALLLRGLRFRGGGADPDTLPVVWIDETTFTARPASLADWRAAGTVSGQCPGAWRVEGDPYSTDTTLVRPARVDADLDTSRVAGAHRLWTARSADGRSMAVVSGAGPREVGWQIMGGWETVGRPHYLEVVPLVAGAPSASPVRLPEPTGWGDPCWTVSGRTVFVEPARGGADAGPFQLVLLRVEG